MSEDIIRSWKDDDFRNNLTPEEAAAFPENPAGFMELSDADLGAVAGGAQISWSADTTNCWSLAKCPSLGGSCAMFTLGCCGASLSHALEDVAVFGGVGALNSDNEVRADEIRLMEQSLARWEANPRLSGEEIRGIAEVTHALRGQVSDADYQTLDANLRYIQSTGTISQEQLGELREYVEAVSR